MQGAVGRAADRLPVDSASFQQLPVCAHSARDQLHRAAGVGHVVRLCS